jgi:hypothetical protein
MNKSAIFKKIHHVHLNKVSYSPELFKSVIINKSHPTQYDESDDLENQKKLLLKKKNQNLKLYLENIK